MSVAAQGGLDPDARVGWTSRIGRALRRAAAEPAKLVVLAVALTVLGALVAYPLALLIDFGLADRDGHPGFAPLIAAFAEPGMVKATVNSLRLGLYVTAGSLCLGVPLAWLEARTDMPGRTLVRLGAAIAFVIPSFITVIAWLALASPNSGYLNVLARWATGRETPMFDIVGFSGLVFVEIAHLYPLVFFAASAAFSTIDPGLEQAARVLGAGRLRIALAITVPLIRPAVLSSAILVLLDALSSFGAPAVIGTMANFSVLTTKIYLLLSFPPRLQLAAAISLPIVVFTLICLALQRWLVGSNRFRTVSGRPGAGDRVGLGRWRWPALAFAIAAFVVTSLLPLVALLLLSLLSSFGADPVFANLTIEHFREIANPSLSVIDAIGHSLGLACAAALACMVLGVLFAWFVERTTLFGRGAVTVLVVITYGLPAITFAVAILIGYGGLLYGTLTILLIAYVAKALPISFVMFRAALKQLSPELEEVARVVGAGWLRTLLEVVVPLLKPSGIAAALLVFALTLRELSMSAILTQPDTEVMSTKVMEYLETGAVEMAAAMAVVILVFSIGGLLVLKAISGKSPVDIA